MATNEPDSTSGRSKQGDKAEAAQLLWALAELLQSDDPLMPDPKQRQWKARRIRQIGDLLLADAGLSYDDVYAWDEWVGNLRFLLGLVRK